MKIRIRNAVKVLDPKRSSPGKPVFREHASGSTLSVPEDLEEAAAKELLEGEPSVAELVQGSNDSEDDAGDEGEKSDEKTEAPDKPSRRPSKAKKEASAEDVI